MTGPRVSCGRCGDGWPADPALSVPCPRCRAGRERGCYFLAMSGPVRDARPSGHILEGVPGFVHPERERAAARELGPLYPSRCPALDVVDLPGQGFLADDLRPVPVPLPTVKRPRSPGRPAPLLFNS